MSKIMEDKREKVEKEFEENSDIQSKLCFVNRCTKVITGGRRFRFSAVVISGNMKNKGGWGFAKAFSVSDAIKRAEKKAIDSLIEVPQTEDGSIPCTSYGERDSVRIMLKSAGKGSGILAGYIPKLALQMCGYKDVLAKNIKGSNPMNQVIAVFSAIEEAKKLLRVSGIRKQLVKNKNKK